MISTEKKPASLLHDNKSPRLQLLADKLCGFLPARQENVKVRRIRDYYDAISFFKLVYREYLIREFCKPHASGLHCTYYCFFPESTMLVMEAGGEMLGTLALIPDTECGIPMESVFPEEIEAIRGRGGRMAEISLLAFDLELLRRRKYINADIQKFSCAFSLFKGMFYFARKSGITDLVMAVHPRLEVLYRSMGFRKKGSVKSYSSVLGKPAVAMHMNIPDWMETTSIQRKMRQYFLDGSKVFQGGEVWKWDPLTIQILLNGRSVPPEVKDFLGKNYSGLKLN